MSNVETVEESSDSGRSQNRRGSGSSADTGLTDPNQDQYCILTSDHCAALFYAARLKRDFVCLQPKSKCNRNHHKTTAPKCDRLGDAFPIVHTHGHFHDGDLKGAITPAQMAAEEQRTEEEDAALREAGLDTKSWYGGLSAALSTPSTLFRGARKDEDRKPAAKPASGRMVAFHTSPDRTEAPKGDSPESLTRSSSGSWVQAKGPPTASTVPPSLKEPPPARSAPGPALSEEEITRLLSEASVQYQEPPSSPPHKSRKARKKRSKKKGRKHRRRRSPSSSSSSSSGSSSSSSDSRSPSPPRKVYAVVNGQWDECGVFFSRREAKRSVLPGGYHHRVPTAAAGWKYIRSKVGEQAPSEPLPEPTPPRTARIPEVVREFPPARAPPSRVDEMGFGEVPLPSLEFQGKDRSVLNDDEFFGLQVDVDPRTLKAQIAPPGLNPGDVSDSCDLVVDAVSLPGSGKSASVIEQDDSMAHLSESFLHLAVATRQERNGEERRRDLKWSQPSRNVMKTLKNEDDLAEMLHHVRQVEHTRLRSLVADQRAILHSYMWPDHVVEAWCYRGVIYAISSKAIQYYISLLEHFMRMSRTLGWDAVKQEMDYHVRKWEIIRNQAHIRVVAMIRLYIYLRDGAHQDWLFPKLERNKLVSLYKTLQEFGSGGKSGSPFLCPQCHTSLHSKEMGCPWAAMSGSKAKDAGRNALKNLAKGPGNNNRGRGGGRGGGQGADGPAEEGKEGG